MTTQLTSSELFADSYLVDVGVPHLCEKTEGGRGVGVVNGKLDVSLRVGHRFT